MGKLTRRHKNAAAGADGADSAVAPALPPANDQILRRATPAEQIAHLNRMERFLLRLFELLSSIKLAVPLMIWLMVECAVGTFVESQVSTPAAVFFVYGTFRFRILLALLAVNIFCAALIRFPWKKRQTGFVVTHVGLLILLAGSMMTSVWNIDSLLSVPLNQTNDSMLDPDSERLTVTYHDRDGKEAKSYTLPVDPGPFTWGESILFGIPWAKNHVETLPLPNGDVVRIKAFFANCSQQQVFKPSETGSPAINFRLAREGRGEINQWLAIDPTRAASDMDLPGGAKLLFWSLGSNEELDHFLNAVPKGEPKGVLGTLAYTYQGKHHLIDVDALKKAPYAVPGTKTTIEFDSYMKNAVLRDGRLVDEGDEPLNPYLKVRLREGRETTDHMAFGAHPELSAFLAKTRGTEHLFSYYPVDIGTSIQLAAAPDGRVGYRAFGRDGLIAASQLEIDKPMPAFIGFTFVAEEIIPKAQMDVLVTPKARKSAQEAKNNVRGLILEFESGKDTRQVALRREMERTVRVGNQDVSFRFTVATSRLPFHVKLNDFDEPKNPGTQQAAMFTSRVTVFESDKDGKQKADDKGQNHTITMNFPLYYKGKDGILYTLYQSGIDRSTGTPISTFTVANDPGLIVKYVGACVLVTGIFLMFYMGGYFNPKKKAPAK